MTVPLIFSMDDSAPGACPAAAADTTRRFVVAIAIRSISTRATRAAKWGFSIRGRPARLLGPGDALQRVQPGIGEAHAGDVRTLMRQEELGVGPALVLLADQVLDRHAHVGEPDLVHLGRPVDQRDGPHLDAGALHVDQQEGDPRLRLALSSRSAPGRRSCRHAVPAWSRSSDRSRRSGRRRVRRSSASDASVPTPRPARK